VVEAVGVRAGHCHGKDVVFAKHSLALNGLLDRRWPRPPEEMPWNFGVVGRGHDPAWWRSFAAALMRSTRVHTIAVEHEDPFVPRRKASRKRPRSWRPHREARVLTPQTPSYRVGGTFQHIQMRSGRAGGPA